MSCKDTQHRWIAGKLVGIVIWNGKWRQNLAEVAEAVWNSEWVQVQSRESTECVSRISADAWKVRSDEQRSVTLTLSFGRCGICAEPEQTISAVTFRWDAQLTDPAARRPKEYSSRTRL